jgi:hypothetical protein
MSFENNPRRPLNIQNRLCLTYVQFSPPLHGRPHLRGPDPHLLRQPASRQTGVSRYGDHDRQGNNPGGGETYRRVGVGALGETYRRVGVGAYRRERRRIGVGRMGVWAYAAAQAGGRLRLRRPADPPLCRPVSPAAPNLRMVSREAPLTPTRRPAPTPTRLPPPVSPCP